MGQNFRTVYAVKVIGRGKKVHGLSSGDGQTWCGIDATNMSELERGQLLLGGHSDRAWQRAEHVRSRLTCKRCQRQASW